MTILVPTDFSVPALKALHYALFIAPKESRIILLHAYMPLESGFYSEKRKQEENREEEEEIKIKLKKIQQEAHKNNDAVTIDIKVTTGVGQRCILQIATKLKADLIVMGTTGASGLKEKLIGSVTADVMNEAPCAVVGVPSKYQPSQLKKIAFASDYMLEDIDALRFVTSIARPFKALITVIHFNKTKSPAGVESLVKRYKSMVKEWVDYPGIKYETHEVKDITEALKNLSHHTDVDMMAMITHRRKGFFRQLLDKSLTKQVAFHAKIPLLSIPIYSFRPTES